MTRKAKQFLDEESGKFLTQGQIKRQRELDREWKNMYERLKAFHKTSGHSNVLRSDPDKALAGWVHGQRNRYSKGTIPQYQVKLLEDLGFVFALGRGYHQLRVEPSETFKIRMEQLRKFKDTHGHVRVPKVYRPNRSLSWWYHQLRPRRRNGFLARQEIAALDEIGFEWETTKSRRAEQLKIEREATPAQLSQTTGKKKAPSAIVRAAVLPKRRFPRGLQSGSAADDMQAVVCASPSSCSPASSNARRDDTLGSPTAAFAAGTSDTAAPGSEAIDDDDDSTSVAVAEVVDDAEEVNKYTRVDYDSSTSPDHSSKIVVASLVWDSALSLPDL